MSQAGSQAESQAGSQSKSQAASKPAASPARRTTAALETFWARLSFRRLAALVTAAYLLIAVLLTIVNEFAEDSPVNENGVPHPNDLPPFLDSWYRYDGGWYYAITTDGYYYHPGSQSPIAFFPVYPLLARLLTPLTGSGHVSLWLLATGMGLAAVLLFAKWCWDRLDRTSVVWALAVAMLYPYAYFLYGSMYAESTFLVLALGAFMALDRGWYLLAGLAGAGATACRPVGVAVAVGLVVRMFERRAERRVGTPEVTFDEVRVVAQRPSLQQVVTSWSGRWREWLVLVSGLGLGGYMFYLWRTFGDPLAFVAVEGAPGWDQGQGPATWFKFQLFARFADEDKLGLASLLLQAFFCLAGIVFLRRIYRLFGWGYAAFTLVVLLIPILGTKDFYGGGRYVLVTFTAFAAVGDWLARLRLPFLRWVYIVGSAAGLVIASALFTQGYPLS